MIDQPFPLTSAHTSDLSHYANPTDRWKSLSKNAFKDAIIKKISHVIFSSALFVGTIGIPLSVFLIKLSPLCALSNALTCIFLAILGFSKEYGWGQKGLNNLFSERELDDTRDYSNKKQVQNDIRDLTEKSLTNLQQDNGSHFRKKSAIHRLDALARYGVVSEDSAKSIKNFKRKYVEVGLDIYGSNFSAAKEEQQQAENIKINALEAEWKKFQANLVQDLPVIPIH